MSRNRQPTRSRRLIPRASCNLRSEYAPDEYGNTLPDFSFAGFRGGSIPLPPMAEIPVQAVVSPGEDIQAGIDAVSALPLGPSGYRGAVLLLRGQHEVRTPLLISASGVVLRGEGSSRINGTLLVGVGPFEKNDFGYSDGVPIGEPAAGGAPPVHTARSLSSGGLVRIAGATGATKVASAAIVPILDTHVPLGGRTFTLPPGATAHFPVGSKVFVRRIGNEAWWNALELGLRAEGASDHVHSHERTVVATEGDKITVDIGLVVSIEERWGGGEIVACEDSGRIFNVGVEDLRGISEFDASIVTSRFTNMDRPLREADEIYGPHSAGYEG